MSYFPLEAHYVGRARGCRNMTVVIENGVLFASAPAGPRVSIQVGRLIAIHNPRRGDRVPIPYYRIECVLANGTLIDCEGYMYSGSIRIDAVDQENHSDFWFSVERGF